MAQFIHQRKAQMQMHTILTAQGGPSKSPSPLQTFEHQHRDCNFLDPDCG